MRISDWSSDVCSSDLRGGGSPRPGGSAKPDFPPDACVYGQSSVWGNAAGRRGSAGRKPAAPGGCARRALVEPYWLQCNRTARPGESDMDRPDYLAAGEPARLIPVTADGKKELRAASILLAKLSSERAR